MPEHTKSAEQRTDEIVEQLNAWGHTVGGRSRELIRLHMELLCRDQRHVCAEVLPGCPSGDVPVEALPPEYFAVLNAPEPGRENQ